MSNALQGIPIPYDTGAYSTYLLEDYEEENQLVFKLQQRKLNKTKTIAEHVLDQLKPNWKDEKEDETVILRREITACFKLMLDCRLFEDFTMFRITAEKKLQIHVQSLKNLEVPGNEN